MIASDGRRFILPTWALTIIFALLYLFGSVWWLIPLILIGLFTVFVTCFFRDPERRIPAGKSLVLSPGDGKIILIEDAESELGEKVRLVSIFLSVFDVHVNRIPIAGKVVAVKYTPGKFHKAFERLAVTENERTEITIESVYGRLRFAQVAGILARRVVCNLEGNEEVSAGERFGLIRFGSRVDIFLDPRVELRVKLG
ncbi:MAG: phosphatidylserine decarboxylase, partial [bacterium]